MSRRSRGFDDYGIGACNRMIARDTALFLGCCVVTLAGNYGIINLGRDFIDYCNSGNITDFSMKIEESLKMSGAVCSAFLGGCGVYSSGHSLKKSLEFKRKRQEEIDSYPCMGIKRNYKCY